MTISCINIEKSNDPISLVESYAHFGTFKYFFFNQTLECSKGFYTILGLEDNRKNLLVGDLTKFVNPRHFKNLKNLFTQCIEEKHGFETEIEIIKKRGNKGVAILKVEVVVDELDMLTSIFGFIQDITEKKELETLLIKSNKLSGLGNWELNLNDNSIYLSERTKEILENTIDFIPKVENGIVNFKAGNQIKIMQQWIEECINEGKAWDEEIVIETDQGNWKWIRSIGEGEFLNNKCTKVYGVIQDINEKKRAEQKIIANNERFNLVSKATNDLIWEWDMLSGETFRLGKMFFSKLGYDDDSIDHSKLSWLELIHPDDLERVEKKRNHIFNQTQEIYWEDQYRFKKRDGSYAYLYDRGYIIRLSKGKAIKIIGSTQNITELKQNELELEELNKELLYKAKKISESEQKYSDLFHLSPLPMWVYDIDTLKILEINEAASKHYGYTQEEFLNLTIKDISPENDFDKIESHLKNIRENPTKYAMETFSHVKKNGVTITVEVRGNYISFGGKGARIVLINDITERLGYISAIENKNEELQQISWMQSHVVRAPVAKIMGIMHILQEVEINEDEKCSLHNDLVLCTQELDKVIHDIANKTHNARLK